MSVGISNPPTARFEQQRGRLRALARRMLGTASEADDAVQETWIRLSRTDIDGIENLDAWLTTVLSRLCLDLLRTRAARREEPLRWPVAEPVPAADPQARALEDESLEQAALVVMHRLAPAERVAFVLHDMFAVPFDEIATILDRTPNAVRLLASRARRRVYDPAADLRPHAVRDRRVVRAFLAAARAGDLDAVLALLDSEVTIEADSAASPTGQPISVRGADVIARQAVLFAARSDYHALILAAGAPAALVARNGGPYAVMTFTIAATGITRIEMVADPDQMMLLRPALPSRLEQSSR
ncbi:sigma-70 family RNA polymerase sigma factor [Nocardia sp. NBC_00511]|uniref:sigma-70 family RNA polymerase sigma factor n=1 Tax=Nocardia sp. NBC_00511 TaxID=2903591 RepID=UPI0030E4F5D5